MIRIRSTNPALRALKDEEISKKEIKFKNVAEEGEEPVWEAEVDADVANALVEKYDDIEKVAATHKPSKKTR